MPIYPKNFEQKIGFDDVRAMLTSGCLCEMGREEVESMKFGYDTETINKQTELVVEFLHIIHEDKNFPTSYYFDLRKALQKVRIEGSFLEIAELFDLKRSIEELQGIVSFFSSTKDHEYKGLKEIVSGISNFSPLIKEIDRILTKYGTIKDNASSELSAIRSQMTAIQSSITRKMQSIVRQLQVEGVIAEDVTIAMRDGRPVIPVASANKKKINGIIHDESATGKTSFIEPADIVEMNNKVRELANAEKREIIRILTNFTIELRPYYDDLTASYSIMGKLDFIRSKALFAQRFDCAKPTIKDFPIFDWYQARHPLLESALKKDGREVIPLNLRLDDPNRILLISGPNAGGKSVCLKTVGILQYMLQCGMLVPISEGSSMGIFESIFIDIGDEQSLENDLSTYSSHLLNMKYFTRNCSKRSLILIDEFGTGTEPLLGGAIAEAVLNRVNQLGTFGVITTHYTNLKHFGSEHKGIVNGAMTYDTGAMKPLFQLQVGKPGSSFAFEIARKIGLDKDILDEATEKLGKEHIDYDKHLRNIVRDKQYWETKRNKIKKTEKVLDELNESYQTEIDKIKQLRREILTQAKEDAQNIVAEANKAVESTIREIREAQAQKEQTREIRKKLTDFKTKVEEIDPDKEIAIKNQMEKVLNRQLNKSNKKKNQQEANKVETAKRPATITYTAGDKVKIKGNNGIAEVIDTDGIKVALALGNMITTLTIDKIEPIGQNEIKRHEQELRMKPKADSLKLTNALMDKKLTFKPDIDIRGQRAEEALSNIQAFIDDAIMTGNHTLRILHGKGYGILKEVIRQYLKSEPLVKSYRDEQIQLGGAGITVVELD